VKRGIPTRYAATNFRSRLEARWAAWFDIVGLEWAYEPFDCDGYIPDFLVEQRLLCEVKPITWDAVYDDAAIVEARGKLCHAFPDFRYEVALLGTSARRTGTSNVYFIGETADRDATAFSDLTASWILSWHKRPGEHVIRVGEHIEGSSPLRFMRLGSDLETLWKEAGNRVQWAARRQGARPL
jgi:hypothetical protein